MFLPAATASILFGRLTGWMFFEESSELLACRPQSTSTFFKKFEKNILPRKNLQVMTNVCTYDTGNSHRYLTKYRPFQCCDDENQTATFSNSGALPISGKFWTSSVHPKTVRHAATNTTNVNYSRIFLNECTMLRSIESVDTLVTFVMQFCKFRDDFDDDGRLDSIARAGVHTLDGTAYTARSNRQWR